MKRALQHAREGAEIVCVAGCAPSAADVNALFDALRQGTSELSFEVGALKAEASSVLAVRLAENSTLTSIDLYDNDIGPEGAQAVAKALETNETLTSINLGNTKIGPAGAQAVAKALETNKTLTSLNIARNAIDFEGAQAVATALAMNKTLTSLNLGGNEIGPEGAQAVAKALETNKTLASVGLRDNQISAEGAQAMAKALEINKSLTTIDLYDNDIGPEGAQAVAKALETNEALTSINLYRNNIGPQGVTAFAGALETNMTLTSIDLSDNAFGTEGAQAMARALAINKTLTIIALDMNNIGPEGAQALATALEINSTLSIVGLFGNNIGPEGARVMAKALEINTSLTSIGLSFNDIRPEGMRALAKALEINRTLTSIELNETQIGDEGTRALAKALETNRTLTSIDLSFNDISSEGVRALAKALEINKTLTGVGLKGNQISDRGARALAQALKTNKDLTQLDVDCDVKSLRTFVGALRENTTLRYLIIVGVKADDTPGDVKAMLNEIIHRGKTGLAGFMPDGILDSESKAILAANQARYDAEAAGPTRVAQGATRALDDSRFGHDRLGYVPYAKALANAAKSAQSPGQSVSIGLFARWGSGKSFLMEKLKLDLRRAAMLPAADAFLTCYNELHNDDDGNADVAVRDALADVLAETKTAATAEVLAGLFGSRDSAARRSARETLRDERLAEYGLQLPRRNGVEVAVALPSTLQALVHVWARLWWRIPSPCLRSYASQVRAATAWFLVLCVSLLPLLLLVHLVAPPKPTAPSVYPEENIAKDALEKRLLKFERDLGNRVAAVVAVCSCSSGHGNDVSSFVQRCVSKLSVSRSAAAARAIGVISQSSSSSEVAVDPQETTDGDEENQTEGEVEVTMPVFAEFNAWVYNGSDVLWAGLVRELYTEVEALYGASRVREHRAWIARYMAKHKGIWPRELDTPDERNDELERFKVAEAARDKRRWAIMAVCVVVGYFILSWIGMLVTCEVFGGNKDRTLQKLCSCSETYALVTGLVCAERLFRDGAVGTTVAALVTLPMFLTEGIMMLRSNLKFTRRFMWRSQGDVLFAEAQKAAEVKNRLGFMNRIKSELDFLFEFLRIEPLYETEDDSRGRKISVKVRLMIFVDDIDRCDKHTIVRVLEAVILLLVDAPITCFMAIDGRTVCTSIEDAHGETFTRAGVSGQEYLDKIIQIPFCLPDLHEDKKRPFVYNLVCHTSTLSHALAHMESVARALDWDDDQITEAQKRHHEGQKEGPPTTLIKLAKLVHALMKATDPQVLRDVKALLARAIEGDAKTESRIKEIVSTWCPKKALDKLVPPYVPPAVEEPLLRPSSPMPDEERTQEAQTKPSVLASSKNLPEMPEMPKTKTTPKGAQLPTPVGHDERDGPRRDEEVKQEQFVGNAVKVAREEQVHATATMFSLDEAAAIGQFSSVLDGNPRHVKRVVNVYNVQRFVVRLLLAPELSPTAVQVTLRQLLKLTIAIEQWPYRMAWLMALVDRANALKRRLGHMQSEENVLLEDPNGSKARLRAFLRQQLAGQDVQRWSLLQLLDKLGRPLSLLVSDTELKRYEQMDRDVDGLWDLLNHEPLILAGEVRRPVAGEWTLRSFVFNQRPGLHEFVGRALEKALGGFNAHEHSKPAPAP